MIFTKNFGIPGIFLESQTPVYCLDERRKGGCSMWNGYGKNCCRGDCWMHYPGNAGAIYASVGEKVCIKIFMRASKIFLILLIFA